MNIFFAYSNIVIAKMSHINKIIKFIMANLMINSLLIKTIRISVAKIFGLILSCLCEKIK